MEEQIWEKKKSLVSQRGEGVLDRGQCPEMKCHCSWTGQGVQEGELGMDHLHVKSRGIGESKGHHSQRPLTEGSPTEAQVKMAKDVMNMQDPQGGVITTLERRTKETGLLFPF